MRDVTDGGRARAGRRRTALYVAALLAVILGSRAVVALAHHRASADVFARTTVTGLSLRADEPGAAGLDSLVLHATYQLSAPAPGARVLITGVRGTGIAASVARPTEGSGIEPTQRIDVSPDCSALGSLDGSSTSYRIVLSARGQDGSTRTRDVEAPAAVVDWGRALRAVCWQRQARSSLHLAAVSATSPSGAGLVLVTVTLVNSGSFGLGVSAVDIADVSTLAPADTGVVGAGQSRRMRVRVPVRRCRPAGAAPVATTRLAWAVGPRGIDPVSTIDIPLTGAQSAVIERAERSACAGQRPESGATVDSRTTSSGRNTT